VAITAHTESALATPAAHEAGARQRGDSAAAAGLPAGLVPVAFSFLRQRVRLLDLRGIDLGEAAFRTSVDRWMLAHPQRQPVELPWSEFLALAGETTCPPPAGFLFNVARCGSTLLANMLSAPAGHVALKESSTIGLLLHRWLTATAAEDREQVERLLTATAPLYSRLASGLPDADGSASDETPAPRLFIKPHSLALVSAALLLRLFPETPAVFLWRDAAEVVASMLTKPVYGGLYDTPRTDVETVFPSLAGAPAALSPAAFNAHLWRSPVEAALALPSERLLLVDYAELIGQPDETVGRLVRHFRLPPSSKIVARMRAAMTVYSKDPSGAARFDPAGEHRRAPLTAEQLAEVQAVVGDLPQRLQAWRQAPVWRHADA